MRSGATLGAIVLRLIAIPLLTISPPAGLFVSPPPTPLLPSVLAGPAATESVDIVPSSSNVEPPQLARSASAVLQPQAPVHSTSSESASLRKVAESALGSSVPLVAEGRSLWGIPPAHGVSVDTIERANPLQSTELIRAGERQTIPPKIADQQETPGVTPGSSGPIKSTAVSASPRTAPIEHVVARGESLWSIARRYRVTVPALADANGLTEEATLYAGRKLVIPTPDSAPSESFTPSGAEAGASRVRSTSIVVAQGQSIWEIAQEHGVSVEALVRANRLQNSDVIWAGQRLTIPPQTAAPQRLVALAWQASHRLRAGLLWPARGLITSGFGMRRHPVFGTRRMHTGVDIGAPWGSPVLAADSGIVIFVGWLGGYGRTIRITHGASTTTLYGHLSAILVRAGQVVQRGDVIGRVGNTGYSTGPHLLFEVRMDGAPVNPLGR